jgi:RimJ/RimL family protein N-acetyltransferase
LTGLVPARDEHFAWMLGEAAGDHRLRLPPGGVDTPEILVMLRGMARRVLAVHGTGQWLMVEGDEVVGLCGYKWPASEHGTVEIGYGVAPAHRRHGHATRAVAALLAEAARDPKVQTIVAETAVGNLPSQRVLEANGFARTGARMTQEDGEVVCWRFVKA